MADLTCYRLRGAPKGPVVDFDNGIDEDDLGESVHSEPTLIGGVRTKLYITPAKPHLPDWAVLLQNAFGGNLDIPTVSGAGALMIVERERPSGKEFLAFTFGYGWRLLRPDAFQRGFGLRTCLNVVFEGDTGTGDWDPARLRSVDSKRVGPTVLRARHQVSGMAALEDLEIDIRKDLVNGVTGIPSNRELWGRRVTGRDALQFSWPSLENLGKLCDFILDSYEGDDYRARFSFIDDFVGVTDPLTRTRLVEEVLGVLVGGDTSTLDMAPPELIDWERVAGFQYHSERRGNPVTRHEIRLADYLSILRQASKLDDLTFDRLRQQYVVWAVDGNGGDVTKWSIWRCLFGEVQLDGDTYVLDDGDFYQVSTDYLAALDENISALPECDKALPAWEALWHEDDYNQHAAESSPDYLLLDRKTVRVASHTNQVEICDLLTSDGFFIHVKKKRDGSASLSHLFNQGFVSADLAIGYSEFRKLALEKIRRQEELRAQSSGIDSFIGKFRPFTEEVVVPRDLEVVFAIYFDSTGSRLQSLPFFSKITLRNMVDELRRRGFGVSTKSIPEA
jgi:uncharacterized protein (TIGR04141 family)